MNQILAWFESKSELLSQGLNVTLFGLLGTFGALIALYVVVILLGKIPEKKTETEN